MSNDVLVALLSQASSVLPDEKQMEFIWNEYSAQDASAIVTTIRGHRMYKHVLPMVIQACRGMNRNEVAQTFIAFLDIHYSSLMQKVSGDPDNVVLIALVLNSLLYDVVDEVVK